MWYPSTTGPADLPLIADLGSGFIEGRLVDFAGRRVLVGQAGEVCEWGSVLRWTELSPAAGRREGDRLICRVH